MAVVVWLVGLMAVVLYQPLTVNNIEDTEDKIHEEKDYVLSPADLEFLDYKRTSLEQITPWKDIFMVPVVMILVGYILYQLKMMWREQEDMQNMFEEFGKDYDEVAEVSRLYNETDKTFIELEHKAKVANMRFEKLSKGMKDAEKFKALRDDVEYFNDRWFTEYSKFSLLDLDVVNYTSDWSKEESVMTIGDYFDIEVERLDAVLNDDLQKLNSISDNVQMLERHYGD